MLIYQAGYVEFSGCIEHLPPTHVGDPPGKHGNHRVGDQIFKHCTVIF